jgi:hypothetical protein
MRKFSLVTLLLLFLTTGYSQILDPVKWITEPSKKEVKTGEEIDLIFYATIDKDWYLYSSEFPCEDGPIKTEFTFTPDPSYQLVGKLQAISPIDKYDKIFECDVRIFKGRESFVNASKYFLPN